MDMVDYQKIFHVSVYVVTVRYIDYRFPGLSDAVSHCFSVLCTIDIIDCQMVFHVVSVCLIDRFKV